MNTSKDSSSEQDPDYASTAATNEKQQKIYEETARSNTARKITAIVDKEFSQEIDAKEKEILQIQERLHKALKTLHLLRYVIITDFYNRKQCLIPQAGEVKQTRIHPAIKQLIGKSPRIPQDRAVPSTSRESLLFNGCPVASTSKASDDREQECAKRLDGEEAIKIGTGEKRNLETEDSRPKKIPRYVPPKSGKPEPPCPSRGVRHKVRKRIVVGNISKWIPPDWREDAASHKWTMYVRSSKEDVDISDFVSKVRFFLHPSYRPNDVVEVTSAPFHLSRRGWGEFPLRVQLHFKNPLNKPMDIIHHLKLDRTYTGLQTLGSETLVDVWIHSAEPRTFSEKDEDTGENIRDRPINDAPSSTEYPSTRTVFNLPSNTGNNTQKHVTDAEECQKMSEKTHKAIGDRTVDENIVTPNTHIPLNKYMNLPTNDSLQESVVNSVTSNVKVKEETGRNYCLQESVVNSITKNVSVKNEPERNDSFQESTVNSITSNAKVKEETEDDIYLRELGDSNKSSSTTPLTVDYSVIKTEPADDNLLAGVPKVPEVTNNVDVDKKRLLSYHVYLDHDYLGDQFLNECNDAPEENNVTIDHNPQVKSQQPPLSNVKSAIGLQRSQRMTSILRRNSSNQNNSDQEGLIRSTTNTIKNNSRFLQNSHNLLGNSSNDVLNVTNESLSKVVTKSQIPQEDGGIKNNIRPADIQKTPQLGFVSNLRPLKISIPPTFEPQSRKLLILNNSQIVSSEMAKAIAAQTQERAGSFSKSEPNNISSTSGSISLLKKPPRNSNVPQKLEIHGSKMPGFSVLRVKPSKSLLLNANYDVPVLKIADSHMRNVNHERIPSSNPLVPEVQEEKPVKAKVTLGKDKHKIQSKRDIYEETLKSIETAEIPDTEAFLRFVMRRLPLITPDASDPEYKRLHPYACSTEEEFSSHNVGKQRAYEWCRAKTIQSFLRKRLQPEDRLWTMKEIIIWSRLHGYTPIRTTLGVGTTASIKGAKNLPEAVKSTTISTCTEPVAFRNWLEACREKKRNRGLDENDTDESQDEEIDIVHVDEPLRVKLEQRTLEAENSKTAQKTIALELDEKLIPLHDFVCETARDIGIKFHPEEVVPNVLHCAAGRVVMRAVECLVEDLLRGSLAKAWERSCGDGYPKIITLDDVRGGITSREEFDVFTNEGLGTRQQPTTMD